MQLKKQMKQLQESLQVLKSEISEQLALVSKDKAHEKEREDAKRREQTWHCRHTA